MSCEYTHDMKKKLAQQIQGIKSKKTLIEIGCIIQEDSPEISENSNGLFMFFESLKDETYEKLSKIVNGQKNSNSDSPASEQKSYKPFFHDEFPSERDMNPKLRYNNKEKSLIKRKQYDKEINGDEEQEYKDFDVSAMSESENRSDTKRVVRTRGKKSVKKN